MRSNDGQILDYILHSERTKYKLNVEVDELTRLQLAFIIECQVAFNEAVAAIEEKQKLNANPLMILASDDEETINHKLALMSALS